MGFCLGFSDIFDSSYFFRVSKIYDSVVKDYSVDFGDRVLILDGSKNKMYLVRKGLDKLFIDGDYLVSTAKNGFGNSDGSEKTPRGVHRIIQKIGDDELSGTVFVGGKSLGRIAKITKDDNDLNKSYITSRILRLGGVEESNLNTSKRGIFIHGTSREGSLGKSYSHGCIRMGNSDIISLYDLVDVGTYLNILEKI